MILLRAQDLQDYMHCPLYYSFGHRARNAAPAKLGVNSFEDALARTIKYFLLESMSQCVPDQGTLRQKLIGFLGINTDQGIVDLMATRKAGTRSLDSEVRRAAVAVRDFYQYYTTKAKGKPLAIDVPYSIEFDDALVEGIIDMVWQTEHQEVYITKLGLSFSTEEVNKDLEGLLQVAAYRRMSLRKEDRLALMKVMDGELITAKVKDQELAAWLRYCNAAARGIRHSVFYPRFGLHCKVCRFGTECKKWSTL